MDGLAIDDLDEFFRELDDPFAELSQDILHMLDEVFGSNPDARTRGAGLTRALSGGANRIPLIKSQIEAQLHDDNRISASNVLITARPTEKGSYDVHLVVVVNGQELGFDYVTDGFGIKRRPT